MPHGSYGPAMVATPFVCLLCVEGLFCQKQGQGAKLAKIDIKSAFRTIPVGNSSAYTGKTSSMSTAVSLSAYVRSPSFSTSILMHWNGSYATTMQLRT